jgi:hypothetical protein
LHRGFSRRSFGRIGTILTAGASLPFYNEQALAQLSRVRKIRDDAVKLMRMPVTGTVGAAELGSRNGRNA